MAPPDSLDIRRRIVMLGIGGIGMSAIARFLHRQGFLVVGFDKTQTPLTESLVAEGIAVTYTTDDLALSIQDQVIYTPAIKQDNPLLAFAVFNGLELYKRSEILGAISRGYHTLAVAGTHGKTSTSTLLAWLLHHAPGGTQAFVGGISRNFDSNLVLNPGSQRLVVEADEFDRSFLTLAPAAAILTSMDADHLDIYHTAEELEASYRHFLQGTTPNALLCAHERLRPRLESVDWGNRKLVFYGLNPSAEVRIERLRVDSFASTFDLVLHTGTVLPDLRLPIPGEHNVLNCAAAVTLACAEGLSPDAVPAILADYQGVKRRFEVLHNTDFALYVDDYAHHPEELRATFQAVRSARPGWPLVVAFQPHLYTRTQDFWYEFAEVLSTPEVCLLLNIYPAREQPIESIQSEVLIKDVKAARKCVLTLEQTASHMTAFTSEPTIFLTVGAGNIDTQIPEVLKAIHVWETQTFGNILIHAE